MKKGFTLVELLAIIVLLSVILAVTIPSVSNIIKNSTDSSLELDAKKILTATEEKVLGNSSFDVSTINESTVKDILNIKADNYKSLAIKQSGKKLYITIVGAGKWDGLIASGTKSAVTISTPVTSLTYGANPPVLAPNMKPVVWNSTSGEWEIVSEYSSSWYSYDTTNKKWANAMTTDGSLWVWIPRFIYNIPSANWHTSTAGSIGIQFTKGIDDNWNKSVIGNIELDEAATSSNGTWTNHPAFSFGNTELTGIWVMKFEASNTTVKPKSVANVSSLRSISLNDMYLASRSMEVSSDYGWGTTGSNIDTHLIKNTEWGAAVYLAQSVYGKNSEIWENNSSTYVTGCTGSNSSDVCYVGCENAYSSTLGGNASTTGNIYGIYDMAGGSYDATSAYIENPWINIDDQLGSDEDISKIWGMQVVTGSPKYTNVYSTGTSYTPLLNYAALIDHKGDALYETSALATDIIGWNSDIFYIPAAYYPWFVRGEYFCEQVGAGVFSTNYHTGAASEYLGFRASLAVGEGL